MNLYAIIETLIRDKIELMQDEGLIPELSTLKGLTVEPPRDPSHGDIATNAAMILARPAKKPPRELAAMLADKLRQGRNIEKVEIAGPGFINLFLKNSFWHKVLFAVLADRKNYGRSPVGAGQKVNLEYVSANPTGPLHVGHCRGAVFGDALANLLTFTGHEVTREYYINDAGAQVDVLARSAFLRYREALGIPVGEIPSGLYPGEYLKPVGEALKDKYGDSLLDMADDEWLPIVRTLAIDMMMDQIRADLARLNIRHDIFSSERALVKGPDGDKVAETITELKKRGLIYEGRLPPPKGKQLEDWEDRQQTLFRATQFGDDSDRPVLKSDGSYTYFATDMAYHRDKVQRGFNQLVNVWGADHGGYVKRLEAAIAALISDARHLGGAAQIENPLDVKICQIVHLLRDGTPVKMSKRAGEFVTLADVVDEVGADAVRFMMLYRKNDAPLDFDLARVLEQSRDNPVFYVQYAHARAHSVFRKAGDELADAPGIDSDFTTARFDLLTHLHELDVIKSIATFPRLVEQAARAHEPHRLSFYLFELAAFFHSLWNAGIDQPHLRFIQTDEPELTKARLALVAATASVLANGLELVGVEAVKEMR